MRLENLKNIWVVGASTGIGHSLVKALDAPGRNIFISARNESALRQIANQADATVIPEVLDITDDYGVGATSENINEFLDQGNSPGLDMVIVNAGTCEYLDGPDIDTEMVDRVMATNFRGAVSVIQASLPLLRQAARAGRRPKLVVMSSSVTYQALPRAHAYGASKAALRYFTECLKIDLEREGIDVHVVSPGFVKTPLTDLNDFPMPFCIEADEAAKRILAGLEKDRFDVHFPKRFTGLLKLLPKLPVGLRYKILGKMARDGESTAHVTDIEKQDKPAQVGSTQTGTSRTGTSL